jgi:hypothetical protein
MLPRSVFIVLEHILIVLQNISHGRHFFTILSVFKIYSPFHLLLTFIAEVISDEYVRMVTDSNPVKSKDVCSIYLLQFYDNSVEIISYSLRCTFYLHIFVLIRIVISINLIQVASSQNTINLWMPCSLSLIYRKML